MGWARPPTTWWSSGVYNYTNLDPSRCEFVSVGSLDDLPNGERLFLDVDGISIVVFNIGGQIFAIADQCSHDDGPLGDGELNGYEVSCPRHGASFDVRTGKVLSLPAVVDIPAYPTRIVDGQIEVGLPVSS
ncbi:MAG: non-heme iron oxygenase ferredoxin subunit [Anaerolineales bacterium]|nr:non-heme iron oxygenase ferredoxin subunit [Anaerolineales bacterium]